MTEALSETITSAMPPRNFLLVGRQGQGKSSVGNSILQSKRFTVKTIGGESSVSIPKADVVKNDEVVVADTSGIGDTLPDRAVDIQSVIGSALEPVRHCDQWFDALIFVLKYGVRFTKQEKDAVQMVKSIFGENVLKSWGILVFSCGDNFYMDTEDDKIKFEDWCREQTGDIKTLFEEVDYRCIIFDNKTKYSKLQEEERRKLLLLKTPSQNAYSEKDFLAASPGREKLILQEKFESFKRETDEVLRHVDQSRESLLRNDQRLSQTELIRQLKVVLQQAKKHYDRLLDEDKGTNVLRELLDQLRLRTIGLRTLIDQLRVVIPDRRIDRGRTESLVYYLMGCVQNSCKCSFDYCIKPVFNFIYGIIDRSLQYFYKPSGRYDRLRDRYPA